MKAKVYSNGVSREEVDLPRHKLQFEVLRAIRQGNGRWSVTVALQGNVYLPDGRRLPVDREVGLNLAQVGRKPRRS